jgi:hypothetical protein
VWEAGESPGKWKVESGKVIARPCNTISEPFESGRSRKATDSPAQHGENLDRGNQSEAQVLFSGLPLTDN